MDLSDIQRKAKVWTEANFGVMPAALLLDNGQVPIHFAANAAQGVAEEAGELCHVFLKARQGIRGYDDPAKVEADGKDALGDIFMYSLDICNRMGWDIGEIFERVVHEVIERDWKRYPQNGRTE